LYYIIRKKQMKFFKALEVFDEEYNELFQVNINPLKFNRKYSVLDGDGVEVITISTGFRILHKIKIRDRKYVCKGNLFKMNYRLYDEDQVIVRFLLKKKNNERYFEIELLEEDNIEAALAVYIVAMAKRFNSRRKENTNEVLH